MSVKFTGLNELHVALGKKTDLSKVSRIVQQNGSEMQSKAMRNAPVDTGNLKRSIGLDLSNGGMSATVEPTANYSPYVEYGTRFMSAQPYVKPAFDAQKRKFKSDMDKLVK